MKLLLMTLLIWAQVHAQESVPEAPVDATALKKSEVVFLRKNKEFAKISIEDTASGIKSIFRSEKLDKGTFILKVEEMCGKKVVAVIGEFFTSSGNTSSEFINEGLSVGQRHKSIENQFVSLSKKSKKGKAELIGCAQIKAL